MRYDKNMKRNLLYLLISLTILVLWQYFGNASTTVRLYISSPQLMLEYFYLHYSSLLIATLTTFSEAFIGLLIATLISFGFMYIGFLKPKIIDFVLPIMIGLQVVPVIVLAPFFIIMLGSGIPSKIAMAAVISFFPIVINFIQGYKAISASIHEMMIIYQASLWFRIRNVYFPLAMPSIMAGVKISASLAVIGAIVSEFTGAKVGIGKNLFVSAIRLDPDLMMNSLVLGALIGFSLYGIVRYIEKKCGGWYLTN